MSKAHIAISAADSHARAMAHVYGYSSPEAREAREDAKELRERAWEAQFSKERS